MNLLYCLYNSLTDSSEITNEVVNNLIKSNQLYCVIRKNIVPEYDSSTYTQYLKLLNTLEIKITTNVNIEKKKDSEHLASTHYNTKYYIGEFLCKDFKTDVKYNFKNMIPSFDIPIKTNLINDNFNKKEFPKIVFKNSFREVYLLEHNKYNQPMTNISVVRKNSSLIKKTNNLIANIYVSLCNKILNYYLDVMVGYKMSFTIRTSDDCMILNFNGLDYVMSKYISEIVNKITYYSLEANSNTKKYFLDVKRDFIENLTNLKYTSPYLLCLNYSSFLLTKDFLPLEAIDFLNELEYEDFLSQLDKLLVFEKEIFIIVGNLNMSTVELMSDDSVSNALEYVEILSLNSLRYKSLEYNLDLTNKMPEYLEEYEKINYTLAKEEINEQEINNCVLDFYLVKQYKLEFYNGSIKSQQLKLILKDLLIYELMTDLINEPLFDKIRTIDKLGYIVKSMLKYNVYLSNSYIYVFYLVQSEYDIKTIYKSINDFNTKFYKDFKANKDKFKKMFTTLKASKISELSKDTVNLEEEAGDYLSCVVNKYGTFNYKNISLEIMREIKFSTFVDYVDDFFTIGIAVNRNSIILDKH
jgi:insulysin